jgi:hypothetical protein
MSGIIWDELQRLKTALAELDPFQDQTSLARAQEAFNALEKAIAEEWTPAPPVDFIAEPQDSSMACSYCGSMPGQEHHKECPITSPLPKTIEGRKAPWAENRGRDIEEYRNQVRGEAERALSEAEARDAKRQEEAEAYRQKAIRLWHEPGFKESIETLERLARSEAAHRLYAPLGPAVETSPGEWFEVDSILSEADLQEALQTAGGVMLPMTEEEVRELEENRRRGVAAPTAPRPMTASEVHEFDEKWFQAAPIVSDEVFVAREKLLKLSRHLAGIGTLVGLDERARYYDRTPEQQAAIEGINRIKRP